MAKNSRGYLSGNTRKLRKKSDITVREMLKSLSVGDRVIIDPKAYYQALPPLRYRNKVGVVDEIRGNAYVVKIKDGGLTKKIITYSMHLRKV